MAGKSKINIFNVMDEEELKEEIKKSKGNGRYYERLIAMKLFSKGNKLSDIADTLEVSFPTVHSWAKNCEKYGLDGLKPNFGGGRPSILTDGLKNELEQRILDGNNLSMTDVQKILAEDMDIHFSLTYVCQIVRNLGFNYGKPRPTFKEAPENNEEIFKKNIEKANITENDIVFFVDETSHILKIQTGKQLYKQGHKNVKEITKEELKINLFGALNITGESVIYPMGTLKKESFAEVLVKLRKDFSEDYETVNLLNDILNKLILSKKEIRRIISANSPSNDNFVARLLRSLKNNKNDDEATLSRKLGKHCKRESTENPKKQEEIKLDHILNLLNNDFLTENLKFERRIVLILDNVPTHRSDFTFQVANLLNIYLLFLPEYSSELNPIEGSWDYSKLRGLA